MFEIVGFICLIVMIGIFFAKIYNISVVGEAYHYAFIFIGLIASLFLWVFYFIILAGSIGQETTITGMTETFTIVNTQFYYLNMFMPVVTFVLIIIAFLTAVEIITIYSHITKRPQGLRGSNA